MTWILAHAELNDGFLFSILGKLHERTNFSDGKREEEGLHRDREL
jgi:hypothetical protein